MATAAHHPLTNSQPSTRTLHISVAGVSGWLDGVLHRWNERASDRRALEWMTERDLRDARLSRWEIERELAKPFWHG